MVDTFGFINWNDFFSKFTKLYLCRRRLIHFLFESLTRETKYSLFGKDVIILLCLKMHFKNGCKAARILQAQITSNI